MNTFKRVTADKDRDMYHTFDFDFLLLELQDTIKWLTLETIKLAARLQQTVSITWIAGFHLIKGTSALLILQRENWALIIQKKKQIT